MNEVDLRFKDEFNKAVNIPSDINEHLRILYEFALKHNHITEMGTRAGTSARAFLHANPEKFIAYDLNLEPGVENLFNQARAAGKDYNYIQANVLDVEIEETDMLFLDTYHTYKQLSQELQLHGNKVRKHIAFHDTASFGFTGEDGGEGLLPAIEEFILNNSKCTSSLLQPVAEDWKIVYNVQNNNGLMILEKVFK